MDLYVTVCFLLFGTFLFPLPLLHECKKPKDCTFQVNNVTSCPSNQTEWNKRSDDMNCNGTNGYVCVPNERFTELLEFCYNVKQILILEGHCLYFNRKWSEVGIYNCRNFEYGCPYKHYLSSKIYEYPSCIHVEKGCFVAELSCKSHPPQEENQINNTTLLISLGVSIPAFFLLVLLFIKTTCRKIGISKRRSDTVRDDEETELLLCGYEQREPTDNNTEYPIEEAIFDQWKQDDGDFISTRACKEVEKIIKSSNLVIVAGHSGSGKSAIIQHIALKYREQGWIVRRVKKVEDIVDEYFSSRFKKNKTICVFNDPLGKEYFDEIFNYSWQRYEEDLKLYLKTAKIVISCRNHIIHDFRVARYLVKQSAIVDIDNERYKLSVGEKRHILTKYTSNLYLSDEDCNEIVEVERYFPLLCKLYSSKEECINKGIRFFTEPVTVLKEEIEGFRNKDKVKYCVLALLVFFNDHLCESDLLKNKDTENKFKHTLKLCGLHEGTPFSVIRNNLDSLKDYFVKMIDDTYHFYNDFVMEVITNVFGTDYPTETIKYADIGFLRKRVRLKDCKEPTDPFTIFLSDKYIEELGKRLFYELFGSRLIDVVLNPCLKNKKIIETLKEKIQKHPEKLPVLLQKKKLKFKEQKYYSAKQLQLTKLSFMDLENDLSPLFALIVHGHTDLSLECLDTLLRMHANFKSSPLLPAVYCNGSIQLFHIFSKDRVKESLTNVLGGFSPIHIVCAFHNYEILETLIMIGDDVNSISHTWNHLTPLLLAAGNDNQECGYYSYRDIGVKRRNKTIQLLLSNGANINLCAKNGASPLYLACQYGDDITVQLLLSHGADINLCAKDGASPLYIACLYEQDSTVQLLLSHGADINLRAKDGASPLYIACLYEQDSTVQLLLSHGADINLSNKDGASPLYTACQNGHDSTVQLLLSHGADINLCAIDGATPLYVACLNGHGITVQLLLRNGAGINLSNKDGASPLFIACQYGHERTVQLLLRNGADINLCAKDGASPLFIACLNGHESIVELLLYCRVDINLCAKDGTSPLYIACVFGHDSTVQLLLSNRADINLCAKNRASPLYIACQYGNDSTAQLLLSHGSDINLGAKDGASPLYIACLNGHDSTVQLLLSHGADINLSNKDGVTPLYIACQNGHDSTVQLLLSHGADINLCARNGSPLYIACLNEHDSTVQLLLSNGADINSCDENGTSPLYLACQNGHDRTVHLLLSNGAGINLSNNDGTTPLYIACQNGHDSTVQLLLRNGADINLCIRDGISPIYIAFVKRRYKTVNILLNNGADTSLACGWRVNPDLVFFFEEQDSRNDFLLLKENISNNLYDPDSYFSLFVTCQIERVTRMIS